MLNEGLQKCEKLTEDTQNSPHLDIYRCAMNENLA